MVQKHVNLVDLVKSFPTNIFLQNLAFRISFTFLSSDVRKNLASVQKRTSPIKFAHLAEKSEKGSMSNLSTKGGARGTVLRLDVDVGLRWNFARRRLVRRPRDRRQFRVWDLN